MSDSTLLDDRLHLDLRERVARMQAAASKPAHLQDPAEVRAAFLAARKPLRRIAQGLDIEDGFIERTDAPIAVRTYVPHGGRPLLAAMAYFHGGGFTTGDLDSHDAIACELALQAHCAVVSIDYRVMPEHRFPAAFDDAVHALRWLPGWARRLGIGETRIAAGGDSSGANLALAAALDLGDELSLKAMWLAYPFIGADFDTPSYWENAEAPLLTRARCQRILADYAARPITEDDWRIAPLLHHNLSGLPPIVAIAGELDPLQSDAEILLERIPANAGSVLIEAKGMPHGFLRWINESDPCAEVANASFNALRAIVEA